MRILWSLLVLVFACLSAWGQSDVPILDFEALAPRLERQSDTVYVINFWATWCKPCVEELPYFEQAQRDYKHAPVKILLVSLDFKHQLKSKLIPFLANHQVESEVVLLYAPDANAWIDRVDPQWTGALPATLIYRGDHRYFHGETFTDYSQLSNTIDSFIQRN